MILRLDEDAGHLFFKCKYAKAVWRGLMLEGKRMLLEAATSSTDLYSGDMAMGGGNSVNGDCRSMAHVV